MLEPIQLVREYAPGLRPCKQHRREQMPTTSQLREYVYSWQISLRHRLYHNWTEAFCANCFTNIRLFSPGDSPGWPLLWLRWRVRRGLGRLVWRCLGGNPSLCLLVGRNFGSRRIDQNLYSAPGGILLRICLFPHAQSFELTVVESEVLDQILADYHGPSFGQHQVLLGIAFHASGDCDHRKSKLIIRQKIAAVVERLLILQFRGILLIEKLLG